MVEVIELQPGIVGFAEDKDQARSIRLEMLLPALERGEDVVLDFRNVKYATQSFIHALLGEALHKYGEDLLDRVEFRNCAPQLRSVIEVVVDYSLGGGGGFPTQEYLVDAGQEKERLAVRRLLEELVVDYDGSFPTQEYLVDAGQEKERLAVRRLLELTPYIDDIMRPLGLVASLSWYILDIRHDRLVGSFKGDVDILAGELEWDDPKKFETLVVEKAKSNPGWHPSNHRVSAARELAEAGGIKWPPSMDYLVGIEAKCAYLNPLASEMTPEEIKSTKSSKQKKIRGQVDKLLRMGFNKVALLDFIANPPMSGTNFQAWHAASFVTQESMKAMYEVLKERLPENSPSGHWVMSMGAVAGGDESMRGAGSPRELRRATENPLLQDSVTQAHRKEMEENLSTILANLPQPRSLLLPVIFIDCRKHGRVHEYISEQECL